MSQRKTRPAYGTPITPDMSARDIAAAIGSNTAEISRWKRLAAVPEPKFEQRLAYALERLRKTGRGFSTEALVGPVPARGRVLRALELFNGMTSDERADFLVRIGVFE